MWVSGDLRALCPVPRTLPRSINTLFRCLHLLWGLSDRLIAWYLPLVGEGQQGAQPLLSAQSLGPLTLPAGVTYSRGTCPLGKYPGVS